MHPVIVKQEKLENVDKEEIRDKEDQVDLEVKNFSNKLMVKWSNKKEVNKGLQDRMDKTGQKAW